MPVPEPEPSPIPVDQRPVVLAGNRAPGPLHLGHYVGALKHCVARQATHRQYLLIDDDGPAADATEIALDYLAVGIDAGLTTICRASQLPALAELTRLYRTVVTATDLAQAAAITAFKATAVPGPAPVVAQANAIVRHVNRHAGQPLLPEIACLSPGAGNGLDVAAMTDHDTTIPLSATPDQINAAVRQMPTGPVENNVVFAYLDAVDPDPDAVADLKARYRAGGLGDTTVKRRLDTLLQDTIAPIRARRAVIADDRAAITAILAQGTERARETTQRTAREIRTAIFERSRCVG